LWEGQRKKVCKERVTEPRPSQLTQTFFSKSLITKEGQYEKLEADLFLGGFCHDSILIHYFLGRAFVWTAEVCLEIQPCAWPKRALSPGIFELGKGG
jgi:hypothetical protein